MDNDQKEFLFYMLEQMEQKMAARDLSDYYLEEHKHSTREEIGIGEYSYGITMVPCSWVYPYLVKLSSSIKLEGEKKDKRLNRQFKIIQKRDKQIEDLKEMAQHDWEERCRLTFELEKLVEKENK